MSDNQTKKNSNIFSTETILKFLGIGGVLLAAIAAPNAIMAFSFLFKDKNYVSWKKFNQSSARQYIGRMEKQNLIKRKRRGKLTKFVLTIKGIKKLLKYDLEKMKLKEEKRWDEKWRVVIFDIKESKKQARDALRSKFRQLGMLQLQKSVFVYPFDCQKEMNFIADFFGVGDDILYLEADIKDIGEKLKNFFKI